MWLIHLSFFSCMSLPWLPKTIPYRNDIIAYSCLYHVNPKLTASIISNESSFNPKAKKYERRVHDYSLGLMQIRYQTAKMLGFKGHQNKLYDPDTNIKLGVKYLRKLLIKYPVNNDGIIAYNQGRPKYGHYCRCYLTFSGKRNQYAKKVMAKMRLIERKRRG